MSKRTIDTRKTRKRNIHNGIVVMLVILKIFGKQGIRNKAIGKTYRKYTIEYFSIAPTNPNAKAMIQ